MQSKPKPRRCAIYTRKSSEEGLEQEFNSLHAQREACEAFIRSQAGEGWLRMKASHGVDPLSQTVLGEKGRRRPPMPRTHPPYAPEYRRRIIELARTGRPIAQLAREFEASANAIRKWVKQSGLDEGLRRDGLTTAEREELNRLRRENRVLREEREILSKAAAWFATETGSVPSRRSNS
jgi:transposase